MAGLIAVPARPLAYAAFWQSVLMMRKPAGTRFMFMEGSRIDQLRNMAVEAMLEHKELEWLLFLDDDHHVPREALMQLLARDKAMIGGMYVVRMPPYRTTAAVQVRPDHYQPLSAEHVASADPVPVDLLGMGCTLIRRTVFEALHPSLGSQPFRLFLNDAGVAKGEDVSFCDAVRAAGIEIFADPQVMVPHIAPRGIAVRSGKITMETDTDSLSFVR
jgi:hypothetical protein